MDWSAENRPLPRTFPLPAVFTARSAAPRELVWVRTKSPTKPGLTRRRGARGGNFPWIRNVHGFSGQRIIDAGIEQPAPILGRLDSMGPMIGRWFGCGRRGRMHPGWLDLPANGLVGGESRANIPLPPPRRFFSARSAAPRELVWVRTKSPTKAGLTRRRGARGGNFPWIRSVHGFSGQRIIDAGLEQPAPILGRFKSMGPMIGRWFGCGRRGRMLVG
jgi:hypothetical protein